jgi:hypothetical protein
MGHECTHAIIPDSDLLSKKIENEWLIEVEHGAYNDLGKHGQYTFCYKIRDDPKTAVGTCREGRNDLT